MTLQSASWIEYLKLGVSLLTLFSITIAYLSYRANKTRERDKELSGQAQKSLEWAYDTLTVGGTVIPPEANRLNWLTAARHILRAQKLAGGITSKTYRLVYEDVKEFWRHKFYLATDHESLRTWAYFAKIDDSRWPENIEMSSAMVVLSFSWWHQGTEDPLERLDRVTVLSQALSSRSGDALREYIRRLGSIGEDLVRSAETTRQQAAQKTLSKLVAEERPARKLLRKLLKLRK